MEYSNLISKMTLTEKASLMSGANFWNSKSIERLAIPSMMLTDGPHGLRKQGGKADHLGLNKSLPATCFPPAGTLSNSWDSKLAEEVGSALGKEAAGENVSVLLGPGLNIKRNPLCGRNFEYFSEDPYLTGKLAAAMVKGIQSEGVSACPKHFAVNSQETHRMTVDEIVDERALHELYLEGFRYTIVEGQAKTVMSAYNKVNGTYANENVYLLDDVLRKQWKFDGLVVTDWGGNNDRVAGIRAGNALEMPSTNGVTDKEIIRAVRDGILSEEILNQRVNELLKVVYDTQPTMNRKKSYTMEQHHEMAVKAAANSMVLLKNENHILPLKNKKTKIGIIGDFAKYPRYQGAGSSLINPTEVSSFLTAFSNKGYHISGYEQGFHRLGVKKTVLVSKAMRLAKCSEVILLFIGLDESSEAEGVDRKHMRIPQNQLELFNAVHAVNPNIVVILTGGSPMELPFADQAKAILHTFLPGQGGGEATAKLLIGEMYPSGKLSESYPFEYKDCSSFSYFPGKQATSEHRESIFIGYRYYDTAEIAVRYPFGHGLSYTSFEYSDLVADDTGITITVTNTGDTDGKEIVQVYIKAKRSKVFRAEKELKGFAKVSIKAGESVSVHIDLDEHAFAFYHTKLKRWVIESGSYEVMVGASSRDIRQKSIVVIAGEPIDFPSDQMLYPSYYKAKVQQVSDLEFESLLGRPLPDKAWNLTKQLTYNNMIVQARHKSVFGKLIYCLIMAVRGFFMKIGKPLWGNNVMFVLEIPFRGISRMSGGRVDNNMLDGIMIMVNGRFIKGFIHLIKAWLKKQK